MTREYPDWRLAELAQKYAPIDAYDDPAYTDEPRQEYPQRQDIGPIADNE